MKKCVSVAVLLLLLGSSLAAAELGQEWKRLVDLRGQWNFSIGDNLEWANPDFDDSDWSEIFAPSAWEEEGYPGYDGYAWYRKSFNLKEIRNDFYLELGRIDDADEVYLNGKLIGLSGSFPPDYKTAYDVHRIYHIPALYLRKDIQNVIAIRVFDAELSGGLLSGKLGMYQDKNHPEYVLSFEGLWKFKIGDSDEWKNKNLDDTGWENIMVPLSWDAQGYKDYDGYAWYRLHFSIDPKYKKENLVLSLGKIDDFDEVYLNGEFVGATGYMEENPRRMEYHDEWLEYRDYRLNTNKLNFDGENVLAVRVYDGLEHGGIYQGPVGIILKEDYLSWSRDHRKKSNIILDFFNFFNPPPPPSLPEDDH